MSPLHYEVCCDSRMLRGMVSVVSIFTPQSVPDPRASGSMGRRMFYTPCGRMRHYCTKRHWFSVNITGQALSQPSFADFVRSSSKRSGYSRLVISEFTETAAVRNLSAARVRRRIADIGSRIALDDYGHRLSRWGCSSLPVQRIKIDGSFIGDLLVNRAHSPGRRPWCRSQAARARNRCRIVETAEWKHVRRRRSPCTGYLYGAPRL